MFLPFLRSVLAENAALRQLLVERGMHPDAISLALRNDDHVKAVRLSWAIRRLRISFLSARRARPMMSVLFCAASPFCRSSAPTMA